VSPATVREKRDLGGFVAEAEGIIESEVVKFIGADDILGFLRGLLAIGVPGNKFGAELGVEYGTEDAARFRA
jgi:hypothetical protein